MSRRTKEVEKGKENQTVDFLPDGWILGNLTGMEQEEILFPLQAMRYSGLRVDLTLALDG